MAGQTQVGDVVRYVPLDGTAPVDALVLELSEGAAALSVPEEGGRQRVEAAYSADGVPGSWLPGPDRRT